MNKLKIFNIGWANSIHVERWLRWFANRGHEISLLTNVYKKIDNVSVFDLHARSVNKTRLERYKEFEFNFYSPALTNLRRIVKCRKYVQELKPDIVHCHSLWYPGYLGVYLNFHPLVITVFNGDVLWVKDNRPLWEKMRTGRALKTADLITGVSNQLVNGCVSQGAQKNVGHVIRRGVDFSVFNRNGDKQLIRSKLKLPSQAKIVLSPRNVAPFYNLKTIVNLVPKIVAKIEDVLFVFIWHENNDGKELKDLANKLNINKNIRFVGKVTHSEVAEYHKASDVMISISDKDSGPVALQEAMACGDVPVISDLACVRELVKDGFNGLLVNPSNIEEIEKAVIKLLLDDKLRQQFSDRNWDIVREKCDQAKEMNKMEQLYYSLL